MPLSLRDVAARTGVSFLFLQKIAGKLRRANIIKAEKGSAGGYYLIMPANKLALKMIVEAVEGKGGVVACLSKNKECGCNSKDKCVLKNKMQKIDKQINKVLEKIKLSNV